MVAEIISCAYATPYEGCRDLIQLTQYLLTKLEHGEVGNDAIRALSQAAKMSIPRSHVGCKPLKIKLFLYGV